MGEQTRFATQVIHAGIEPDAQTGAVMTPIYQTSTYAQASPGEHQGYEYSRTDNPTRTVLQTQLAALERADAALVFGSGLAAVDAVLNLCSSGDHVVAGSDLYGGTYRIFTQVAQRRGIEFTFVDPGDHAALEAAFRPNSRLLWLETPTNPLLQIVDIAAASAIAHAHEALVAVDNTFMSPAFQRPLTHGADIVMHSMTKYLNGHSDVVMGALMVRDQTFGDSTLATRLKFLQNSIGAVPGPFDCFLVLRGIKTLAVRMDRHAANAAELARRLESDSRVRRVLFPGLRSHPQHEIHLRQTTGASGMITIFVEGGLDAARQMLERVKIFTLAESLGGVESLIEHPAIMTHASIPREIRQSIGLTDDLVRLSVGIEDVEDLWADLDQALIAR